LSKAPADWMRTHLTVQGERLHAELRGRPSIAWAPLVPAKQNICTARGFGQLLGSKREVAEALCSYTANCAEKLRAQRSCTSKIQVFVETNAFRQHDKQYFRSVTMPLPVSTHHTAQLIKHALRCLDIVFEDGYLYHKCGIVVMDLVPEEELQYGLFNAGETPCEKGVMAAFDKVNRAFGKDTVRFAAQGFGDKWKLKQAKLSPRYTTRMDEILKVKI
jgi:DNA polymerase V